MMSLPPPPPPSSVEEFLSTSEKFLTSNSEILTDSKITQIVPNIYFKPCIYDLSALGKHWNVDKFRICYVNGICTFFTEARGTAMHLSELLGNINIFGVYNPSYSLIGDLCRSVALLGKKKSQEEKLLHQVWNDFFSKSNPLGYLLQVCSSQGAILVRNALCSYCPELRKFVS